MMIGLPGSGKSTLCEDLIKNNETLEIVSTDIYIENYAKKKGNTYQEVYREAGDDATKWMSQRIKTLINEKKNFIWDQTNVFKSARRKKLAMLGSNKYSTIAVGLELSEQELFARIKTRVESGGKTISYKIIHEMAQAYERPDYSEGFTYIFMVGDNAVATLLPKSLKPEIKNFS